VPGLCYNFAKGDCKFGVACKFKHISTPAGKAAAVSKGLVHVKPHWEVRPTGQKGGAAMHKSITPKFDPKPLINSLKSLVVHPLFKAMADRKQSRLKPLSDQKGWTVVGMDQKECSAQMDLLEMELDALKKVMWAGLGRSKNGVNTRSIPVKLFFSGSVAGAANTNYAPAGIPLTLNSSSEFAAFASLFEEVRGVGGVIHFGVTVNGALAISPAAALVAVYDPLIATALTGVPNGMEVEHHLGPIGLINWGTGTTASIPLAETPTGFYKLPFKVAYDPARLTSSNVVVSGEWSSTSDAADIYGYLKFFGNAQGAGSVLNIYWICEYHVLYRGRL